MSLVSFSFKWTHRIQNVYTELIILYWLTSKKIPILHPALRAKLGRVTSNKAYSDWDLWMKADSQWVSLNGSAECITTAAPVLFELISGQKHTERLLTQRALSAVNKCFSLSKSISSHCVPFEGRPTILLISKERGQPNTFLGNQCQPLLGLYELDVLHQHHAMKESHGNGASTVTFCDFTSICFINPNLVLTRTCFSS